MQASIGGTYSDFLSLVSKARRQPVEKIDAIAGGRVWDGGTARQLGLVDEFGGLPDALAWVAAKAGVKDGKWHAVYLGEQAENYDSLIRQLVTSSAGQAPATHGGDIFALAARGNGDVVNRVARDAKRLLGTRGIQAYCLECSTGSPRSAERPMRGSDLPEWLTWLTMR